MENKNNTLGNIESINTKDNNILLKADTTPFTTSFYFSNIYEESAVKKFIKNTERIIRQSKEYKKYIELLRNNIGVLNHDNLLHNVTNGDLELEFHHYPLSLYEIVDICMFKLLLEGKNFTSLSLAKYVMEQHYKNNIGLVSLMKTTHELAHDGEIFLSSKQIFGNYRKFIEEHKDVIDGELIKKINEMEELTNKGVPSDYKGLL